MSSIGERIKTIRKCKGFTLDDVAKNIGISKGNLSSYENNRFNPSAETIVLLSKLFQVSTDDLLISEPYSDLPSNLLENEQYILSMYSSLNEKNRNKIEGMLELLCSDEKNKQDEKGTSLPVEKEPETKNLQILGYTAAGSPIEMPVDPYSFSDLTTVPVGVNADFALQVTGDSMEPTILNNSIICIKKQPEVANGQIAVISLNNTVTCKRFYRDNGNIKLLSDNPAYDPIIIEEQDEIEVRVIGKVVK